MKKFVAVLLSASMVIGSMTACGGGSSTGAGGSNAAGGNDTNAENNAEGAESGEAVVINYYDWDASAAGVVDRFNESQDDIKVVFTQIPDNMDKNSKLDVLAMGGGDIDVLPCGDGDQFTRMQNSMFAPLDDYIAEDGLNMEEAFGAMGDWCVWNGVTYGLPIRASVGGVFYNKDAFDEAGIAYPDGSWTWDDYLDIATKLTKGEGADKVYGTYNHVWAGEWIHPAVQIEDFYKEDGTSNINSENFVKYLNERKALDDAGVQPSFTEVNATQAMPNSYFLGGKCAMVICGAWLVRDMKDKENYPYDFEIGFNYFPRTTEDVTSEKNLFMGATMLGVAATSKHPKEAYEFIKYMVTEGSVDVAAGGNYPCYKMAFDDAVINAFIEGSGLPFEEGQKLFADDVVYNNAKPIKAGAAAYMDTMEEQEGLFFTGDQDAKTTLDNVAEAMNEEIEALK